MCNLSDSLIRVQLFLNLPNACWNLQGFQFEHLCVVAFQPEHDALVELLRAAVESGIVYGVKGLCAFPHLAGFPIQLCFQQGRAFGLPVEGIDEAEDDAGYEGLFFRRGLSLC